MSASNAPQLSNLGQPQIRSSNRSAMPAVQGADIGRLLPGIVESLQESSKACVTANLYYNEQLGSFNMPSFQTHFGLENKLFQNLTSLGDTGFISLDKGYFWKGPAILEFKFTVPWRWCGFCPQSNGTEYSPDPCKIRPQVFYSWGAGYVAAGTISMNLGGAQDYQLSKEANFVSVMASCYSSAQRACLMKLSGGGVIKDDYKTSSDLEKGSTADYKMEFNYGTDANALTAYDPVNQVNPETVYVPVKDRWLVVVKTPHTNFHNSRYERKPIDTNITNEPFTLQLQTSLPWYFMDDGSGYFCLYRTIGQTASKYTCYNPSPCFMENFRNFLPPDNFPSVDYFGPDPGNTLANSITWANAAARTNAATNVWLGPAQVETTSTNLKPNTIGIDDYTGTLEVSCIMSTMKLTNWELGALKVLANITDQAVYYPFQHATTQIISLVSTWQNLTMDEFVEGGTPPDLIATKEDRPPTFDQPIQIPVNPLTVMYVMILREKDRIAPPRIKGPSYSPALPWNGLKMIRYDLSYGGSYLFRYGSYEQDAIRQMYDHSEPLIVPYMGGACSKNEMLTAIERSSLNLNAYRPPWVVQSPAGQGLWHGVRRNSYIYEFSLVERPPLTNEAVFQQTPSFVGEQLQLTGWIEPTLTALQDGNFDPFRDLSYCDSYPQTSESDHDTAALYSSIATEAHNYGALHPSEGVSTRVTPRNKKGYGTSDVVQNPWVLNNGPLYASVVYMQNALWQMNPNMSKLITARG